MSHLKFYVCIAVFTVDAGLLARSQYSEGPVCVVVSCLVCTVVVVLSVLLSSYV
jgi:hypothetical protein